MKYTLLELTQDVLSSMDSDEINSISDTVESQQVVKILKTVYDDIATRGDPVSHRTIFNLNASGDITKPTLMTKPDSIDKIAWLRYNTQLATDTAPVWNDLKYMPIDEFIIMNQELNGAETNVGSMVLTTNGFTYTFFYLNDTPPRYYTTPDDVNIIFDAYDNTVDTTLQSSKTMCYGSLANTWTEVDTFVPNLQPQQFALLLNEAKSLAWAELKQTPHQKAETTARRNWQHLSKTRQQIPDGAKANHPFDQLPSFGRTGGRGFFFRLTSR